MKNTASLVVLLIVICIAVIAGCKKNDLYELDPIEMKQELEADISYLSSDDLEGRESGTPGARMAADYIVRRMKTLGLEPAGLNETYFQDFSVDSEDPHEIDFTEASDSTLTVRNVLGYEDNGADYTIVVGAHYDHLGWGDAFGSLHDGERAIHNGADDNASGVAAMLQIAEMCKERFDHANFLYIAFSGEEKGLWGSNYFTKNPTIDLEDVNYMINLDMVGRLKPEKKLSINSTGTAAEWIPTLDLVDVDSIEIVTTESGIGSSDHTSFYNVEIPALHFFTGQHEDYHKPSDDEDKINYEGIVSVVKYIGVLIEELEDDGMLTFQETKNDNQNMARDFKVTLGVMPDYLYNDGGMRIDGIRPDRPAANSGIEKGDIVLKMGDIDIADMESYMMALGSFEPGQTVPVIIKRGDQELEIPVTFD